MTQFKAVFIASLFFLFSICFKSYAQQTAQRDENGRGYLEYLPPGYNDNSDLYPVIIFLHGQGERGNGSPSDLEKVKRHGPPKHIKNGHNMCFEYNGVEECFIVLSPQISGYNFWAPDVMTFIETAVGNYRIDPERIHLMGISMGGIGVWRVAYSDENEDNIFAALSVAPGKGEYDDACKVAEDKIAVWAFHGTNDNSSMPIYAGRRPIEGMIACDADPAPIFTVYEGVGHNSWDRAYRTDNSLHTPNIYQWFLAQRLSSASPKAPTVNAGSDRSITLPENIATFSATANDQDGDIVSILWERISGPNNPTESDLNQLNLSLSNLIEGSYNYRITVTDNDGLSASDQVIITVLPEPVNIPPIVNAGNNRVITLPTNSLTLNGTASDSDGTVASTLWAQVSGPNAAGISSPNNLSSLVNNLIEGNYTFRLTATDNDGESVSDNVTVTVQPEPPNNPPSANAGNNLTVTLPDNSISIIGSGTDSDGTITSFIWVQSSGPNTAATTNLNEAEITISDLIQGSYVFTLTVIDDEGDSDSDQVTINVLPPPPNDPPTANAGANQTITLPDNSVNLQGQGNDADGTIDSYLWEQESGPNTANLGAPTEESTSATGLVEGIYIFSLTVTDNDGETNSDNVQITVLPIPPNEPPTVTAGNNRNLTLPINFLTLSADASDSDGTIEIYLWEQISGPDAATFDATDTESIDISDLIEGVYQFLITVTDDDGATASDQINVTVYPEQNEAPDADAGSNISITLPINSATLQGSGADSDGSIEAYNWTQVTGPNIATIVNANSASTVVQGLIEGVYSFRLSVTDNDGASDTDQMTLTVLPEPVNIPPTADAGEDVYLTLPDNSTILTGQGTDPDGTIVSYIWNVIETSNSNIDEIDDFEVQNLQISGLEEGIYIFSLTVFDDRGAVGSDQVRVFVDTPNLPPNADAGSNINITLPQNSVNLSGSASDQDGEVDFTLWEQISGPNDAVINSPLNLNTSVDNLIEGIYIFNFYIEDNDGLIDEDQIRITVNPTPPNIPPNVNAGNDLQVTLPVEEITLNGSGNDPDGTISSRQWTQINGPNSLNGTNLTTYSPRFTGFEAGTYTLRLVATDNDGAQGSDDVRIIVLAAPGNQLPSVDAGTNITVTLPNNTTQLNGNAFDVDGTIENYTWTQHAGPNSANILNENQASTTLENLIQGIYTFRLSVVDNQGGTAFDQVNVRVNPTPANQPPVVIASNNQIINFPQTSSSLTATANDADGTINSILWVQRSGPSPATLSNITSLNLGVENLQLGTYVFRITVTDNSNVSSFDEVNIRVLEALANQPPAVDAGTNQLIFSPNNAVTVIGSAQDSDGSIVSNEWLQVSGPNTAAITSPENYETGISNLIEGTYVFRLEVTDNFGLVGFDQVSVRVNAELPNLSPNVNAGDNKLLVLPDNQTILAGEANDSDGSIQSIVWTQEFGTSSATLTGVNGFNLEVSDLIDGFYVFRLTVIDNEGATDFDEVSVTVNEILPKQPPTVNAGADQNVILPEENIQLSGNAISGDGTITSIVWEQLSGPTEATINNASEFDATVNDLTVGTYVLRLVVQNSENLQNFDLMTINVSANQAPYAFAGTDTTLTLPINDFMAAGQGVDNDGTIEGVAWTQLEGPNTAEISNSNSNQTIMNNFVEGSYRFEFRVVDNKGAESFDILRVEVNSEVENSAPSVDLGEDITVQLPVNSVTLQGSGTDADGSIEAYLWEQESGPNTAGLVTSTLENTEATGLIEGIYTFSFTVTDDDGATASAEVNVTVLAEPANVQPIVEAGEDITITLPENSVELTAEAEDPDGTIVQYRWERIEGGEFTFLSANESTTIVNDLELGNYIFQLTVVDDGGLETTDRLNVFVIAPDEPPFITAELTKLFTPNGDGTNDIWVSEALNQFSDCSVIIYNRLGVKIFEEENYQNNWAGTDQNGRIVEEGAYFYVVSCENNFVKRGGVRIKK